jgi:acyl-CoA-binding protein
MSFSLACEAASGLRGLSTETQLRLYSLFKQATVGPCTTARPSFLDFSGRAKHDAWSSLGAMPADKAKELYVGLVTELAPGWEKAAGGAPGPRERRLDEDGLSISDDEGEGEGGGRGAGGAGRIVSREVMDEGHSLRLVSLFRDVASLERAIAQGAALQERDENGMTALHHAADRGVLEAVVALVKAGADKNAKDNEGYTPKDYASPDLCDHPKVYEYLVRELM